MTAVRIVSFEDAHLEMFEPQAAQRHELEHAPHWAQWSVMAGGRVVGIGGLQEIWRGRAYVYALLASDAGPHLLGMTRAIRFHLKDAPFARIELVVESGFAAGCRWAELLGFALETPEPLRHFLPSGRDAWIYTRFQDGMGSVRSAGDAARGRAVR